MIFLCLLCLFVALAHLRDNVGRVTGHGWSITWTRAGNNDKKAKTNGEGRSNACHDKYSGCKDGGVCEPERVFELYPLRYFLARLDRRFEFDLARRANRVFS